MKTGLGNCQSGGKILDRKKIDWHSFEIKSIIIKVIGTKEGRRKKGKNGWKKGKGRNERMDVRMEG